MNSHLNDNNNNNLKFIEHQDYEIFKGAELYVDKITLHRKIMVSELLKSKFQVLS